MEKKIFRGFTLIELLVVIAIIGILAAIVFVNVGGARNKAKDTSIKENLRTIQTNAFSYYEKNGNYTNFGTDPDYSGAASAITGAGGTPAPDISTDKYCVSSPLASDSATNWCVDASGFSGVGTCTNQACGSSAVCSSYTLPVACINAGCSWVDGGTTCANVLDKESCIGYTCSWDSNGSGHCYYPNDTCQ